MDTSSLASAPVAIAALSADVRDRSRFVITSHGNDVNHIHSDYFGKGCRWPDPNLARRQQPCIEARRFLDARGIPVKNVTIGGHLEVFERADYATLFNSETSQGENGE